MAWVGLHSFGIGAFLLHRHGLSAMLGGSANERIISIRDRPPHIHTVEVDYLGGVIIPFLSLETFSEILASLAACRMFVHGNPRLVKRCLQKMAGRLRG